MRFKPENWYNMNNHSRGKEHPDIQRLYEYG